MAGVITGPAAAGVIAGVCDRDEATIWTKEV